MTPGAFAPVAGSGSPAEAHARVLLSSLGAEGDVRDGADPHDDWTASGLCGAVTPGPVIALRGALLALRSLAPQAVLPGVGLLGERAALLGYAAPGLVSSGGATRLLACADGWVALALARDDDRASVPALVGGAVDDPWDAVAAWCSTTSARDVRDRAVLLGLACAIPGETTARIPWETTLRPHVARPRPVVLDLSALWAGPLCSALLASLGCDVVKVEDPRRPDGARATPAWFDRLYPSPTVAALDDLGELLPTADVVIEASRPRALRQRGFRAEEFSGVWISITGHGRGQPDRIGYGDDTAVAGGLVGPGPSFVGDAIADPLTGVHAAVAAWVLLRSGRGGLVDVALARTAAVAAGLG